MIREAFKRLFAGEEALQNHLILFVMTGFVMMLSKVLNMFSTPPLIDTAPWWLLFTLTILMPVAGLYMAGYMYRVNHKAFDDSTAELLPKFSLENFKVFFKFLPVLLLWVVIGVTIIAVFNSLVVFAATSKAIFITWRILYRVCFGFYLLLIPFVHARFCENYDRKGLYNPLTPIKDFFKSFKSVLVLVLKLIPLCILLLVFIVFSANYDIVGFLFTALFAYFLALVQYVINYCYVQIYREQLK